MMKGFNINNEPLKTLNLFEKMKKESILLNEIIFLLLIDAYSQIGIISRCKTIVESVPSSMLSSPKIQTTLIDMWVKDNKFSFIVSARIFLITFEFRENVVIFIKP